MPEPRPHPSPGGPPIGVTTMIGGGPNGGGHLVVATDALLAQVDALGRLGECLRLAAGEVVSLLDRSDAVGSIALEVPLAAIDARRVTRAALQDLWTAQQLAVNIRDGVLRSIERYASTEHLAAVAMHGIDEQVAWGLGQLARTVGLPLALVLAGGLLADCAITRTPPSELGTWAQDFLESHPRILTNPLTVSAIREAAADTDGFGDGFLGLPLGISDVMEQAGVTGVPSSSATVVGIANVFGLLKETPVSVHKTSSFEYGTPPTSLADRSQSFPDPHADPNGEQIRIDRYVTPGRPDRFDVYIAGTVTFDPKTGTQPFDFASDLTGVANGSPASYRAVEAAMAQAGVTSSSPVVFNGYSQGGLVASLLAASGKYNVKGVVTFGAPSAQVAIPASIPVLSVRNSEDLVPATSGYDTNPHAVVVQRTLFDHSAVPSDWTVPAHRLGYYQQTAADVDKSRSTEVRGVLEPLDSFGAGTERVDSTLWVAKRVAPAATIDATNLRARAMV
ncbi:MAG TPA: hypothetical protein VHX87_09980 [Galbitalea sp.]|jgi:pimeloyl-ACP methyl ester carboxylesterase|nr:hypothetical protein [Galbitalea sp.]